MPRLGYSKSRTGCRKCRQRRVKCDENRPCGACLRHGIPCSLVTDGQTPPDSTAAATPPAMPLRKKGRASRARSTSTVLESAAALKPPVSLPSLVPLVPPVPLVSVVSSPAAHAPSGPGTPSSTVAVSLVSQPTTMTEQEQNWATDMELMHHYATTGYQTMPRADEVGQIWQVEAVRAAFADTYLLHLILAYSAFHLAHLRPQRQAYYAYIATYHQNLGICDMRATLARLDGDNCHALFMGSSLLTVVAFASLTVHVEDKQDSRPMLDDIVEVFVLLRGLNTVLISYEPAIQQGPFHGLFQTRKPSNVSLPFWTEIRDRLQRLREPLAERLRDRPTAAASIDGEILSLYDLCLHCLGTSSNPELRLMMLWPIRLADASVQLFRDKDPAALILLAYYCVVVQKTARRVWFTKTWAPVALQTISQLVPPGYTELLQWPLELLNVETP